jgi:hypothetical protein
VFCIFCSCNLCIKSFSSDLKYLKTIKYFGEDENKIKFEDFFTMWHLFLQSYSEIKTELKMRKQRELEEEKKIKDLETIPKAKLRQSMNIPTNIDIENTEGFSFGF